MPHIAIKLFEGKTEDQKKELATALVKAAQSVLGLGDASYSVSIEDATPAQWKKEVYPKEIMGNKDILYKEPGYEM